jgi:hypothetical protein
MDTNKPQTSDEEGAQPPPVPARSPYRPLSLRRRQALPAEPQPAVERPPANSVFSASPSTIAAALTKRGPGPERPTLVWGRDTAAGAATTESEEPSGK